MMEGFDVPGASQHCVLCEPKRPRAKQKSDVRSIGRRGGARKESDDLRIFGILYVHDVGRVIVFAAIGFQRFVHGDDLVH